MGSLTVGFLEPNQHEQVSTRKTHTHTHARTHELLSSSINWITCLGQELPEQLHKSTAQDPTSETWQPPQSSRVVLSLCKVRLQRCTACPAVEFRRPLQQRVINEGSM